MLALGIVLLTILANLLIAIIVIKKNPYSTTNRLVAALSIITALWTGFNYLALSPGTEEIRLFWVRTVMFVTSSYGTVILLLADVFPGSKLSLSKRSLLFVVAINILSYTFSYSPYMFTKVQNSADGGFMLYPGWAIIIFAIGFMGFMTWGFIKLIRKFKASHGVLRTQLRLFLTGLIISFSLLTLTNFIAVVVFRSIQLTYLGPPFTLILFAFMVYSIVRHRFLDITALVARAVSFTLMLAIVVLIEASIVYFGVKLLPGNIDTTLIAVIGATLIVMSYNTISSVIVKFTDSVFFQGRYNTEVLLKSLSDIMVKEVLVDKLTRSLLTMLTSALHINTGAFVILKDGAVRSVEFVGYPHDKIPFTNTDLAWLLKLHDGPLAFEDLTQEEDKEYYRRNHLALIHPLNIKDQAIGYLLLGPKSSGDIYLPRDFELLNIFAPQAAIAIKNAESLREIQEFNSTLSGKVAERTRELEASQAKELQLKDEFVFIATHDLATPVTAISGFSEIIKKKHFQLPTELDQDLHAIDEASKRLKVLVNDLLQVARSDSGTIKIELTKVKLDDIVEAAVLQAGPMAKEKKVTVTTKLDSDNTILADPKKLAEIVENLISNGIKYNKDGGTLEITSQVIGSELVINFKDSGIGIDKEEQAKVFTKFFRSEEAEVRQRPGTGLGLFVVRMLTEKMGGTISFTSVEGEGSTFTLKFKRP